MSAVLDRVDFSPPPEHRTARAYGLALLAHAILLAALTWGVNWRRQPQTLSVEAELWSTLPAQAAPKLVEPPPPPPPPPPPKEEVKPPPPPPPPAPKVEARKPEPVAPDPQIAIEKERKRLEKLEQEKEKKEREELRKQEIAEQKRLEKERKELERIEREKKLAEEKAERERKLAEERAERERQRLEAEAKERARQEAIAKAQAEAQRQANIARMAGLANASGGPTAVGTALQSSGPSAGYAGKIRALLRPKIVFPDNLPGNPQAEIEVRTSPDGSVISRRVVRSSGVPAWDDAVLKAIDKTDRFPPDTEGDGKVPPQLVITFRPKDF